MTSAAQPEPEPPHAARPRRPGWRYRHGDGLEFDRVAFFSDAVYAIAMTLLIVPIEVPHLPESDADNVAAMWAAIQELFPSLFSFFLAFWLLGRFWLAHHGFVSSLRAVNRTFMAMNLVYLAFVASLPFPSALLGRDGSNPVSVVLFASSLVLVSSMETAMLVYSHRAGLRRTPLGSKLFRAGVLDSVKPTVVFLISIPLAFVSTTFAMLFWLVGIPLTALIGRLTGVQADELRTNLEG